jgi:hypothetical protein
MPAVWGVTTHAKIASGQSVGAEVDLRGLKLYAIGTPAALTGNTLAFQQAEKPAAEGGVYSDVKYLSTLAATQFTITGVAASQTIYIQSAVLPEGIGNGMIKLVSSGAEGADRDFILYTEPY